MGRPSDDGTIHIDDDKRIDQEEVAESNNVGTAPRPAQSGITIEFKLQDGVNISTATINVLSEASRRTSQARCRQKLLGKC